MVIDFTLVSGTGLQQPQWLYPALIWTLAISVWTLLCLARTQAHGDLAGGQLWWDKSDNAECLFLGVAVWTGGFHAGPATAWASLGPGEFEFTASVSRSGAN